MHDTCERNRGILDRTTHDALEQTWAVVTAPVALNPAVQYVRLITLARSNALLWTEAALEIEEQVTRGFAAGRAVTRTLVLATVAADILSGYAGLATRARWLPSLIAARDRQWQDDRGAQRVLETASTLGGALIKACQFASTRPDLLPARYIRALALLQDCMPPRPWSEIEATIESELGRPLDTVFAEIEHTPVAAASISQVHLARLRPEFAGGEQRVAVKVQYEDIRDLVDTDLSVLDRLVKVVARVAPAVRLQPVVDYLRATLPLELDFTHEAEAQMQLRAALQHRSDVAVPAVIPELCTGRLIVMEDMDGIKITERDALEQAGIDPASVASLLNDVYADQMLRRSILHADPHPGNLLVQPGPRLVLLDHGLTVPLAPALVESLRQMVGALLSGDSASLTKALAEAGVQFDEGLDLEGLLELVGVILGNAQPEDVPYEQLESEDFSQAAEGRRAVPKQPTGRFAAGVKLGKSIGSIPVDLLFVGRTLGLLDGITKQLDPSIDTLEIVSRYVR